MTDSQADGFAVERNGARVPMTCSAAVVNPSAPIDGEAVGLGHFMSTPMPDRSVIRRLRRQLAAPPSGTSRAVWSSGIPCIDEMLPDGGFRSGSLVEWLGEPGSGVSTLLWRMAAHWQSSRSVILIDPERKCFPPGVANLGVDLRRLLVLQPDSPTETLWSLEQSLRCRSASVVLCRLDRLPQQTWRRLRLAVERGGGLGLFLRSLRYRRDPTWTDVRFACAAADVQPAARSQLTRPQVSLSRRLQVELLHVRGGGFRQQIRVMSIDDEARVMSVDSELAGAAASGPSARAS
jgi:protein ImuA